MIKNPLKYQRGGTTASQEQLVKLFQAAAENAQVDPEQLVQKASEIGQDEEAVSQFMQGLQLCAQGDPEGIKFIKSLFQSPAFRKGGKIFEFICKHAKGGYVSGCGCGGNVKKAQDGTQFKAPTNYYNEKGWQISENNALRRNNRTFYTEEPTTAGNLAWTNNQMSNQLMWPGIIQDVQYNQPVGHYVDEYGNMHDFAIEGNDLARYNNRKAQWKENGGKVEKVENGKKVNNKTRTVTNVNSGLSKYEAEGLGIDPNTVVNSGSTITAFPNRKPYIVNGQVPFNKRNAVWFSLGGTESGPIEDGVRIGGIPGRKYKVSQIGGQETNYGEYSNPEPYPYIIRYASPKDTIYNVGFTGYNSKSIAYPGIRTLYNAAIDSGNIVAQDAESHRELQRQRQERAPKKENK